MGQVFDKLTNPNSLVVDSGTGQPTAWNQGQFAAATPEISAAVARSRDAMTAGLPPQMNLDASGKATFSPSALTPTAGEQSELRTPSFQEAAQYGAMPGGANALSPGLSKMGKLGVLLMGGLQGAMAGRDAQEQALVASGGRRAGGAGVGFMGGYQLPFLRALQTQQVERGGLENTLLGAQAQFYPQLAFLNAQKTGSEISKNVAEAGHAQAQAQGQDYVNALKQAEAAKADITEMNGVPYRISTGKPVVSDAPGQYVPADAQMGAMANIPQGTPLPLQVAQKLKSMANEGITTIQANGRSLIVDKTGKTIADMGTATPLAVINAMNPFAGSNFPVATGEDALKGLTPQQATLVKGVANYEIDPNSLKMYRSPQGQMQLLALAKAFNPAYDQTQYGTKSALRKSFTSGADAANMQALNTVAHHLGQLDKANDALDNGNVQLLNQIANAYKVKAAGQSAPVVFDAIKNAVAGELSNVFKKSGATDPEIANVGSTISNSLSKGITKDVIAADVGLVQGRLKALQFKYENGMGAPADFRVISPEAEQMFNKLGGGGGQISVTAPDGSVHSFADQASANKFRQLAGIQ
jgi:hypothetical protein